MAGDVWTRVALPVLEAVANAEGKDHRLSVVELAKRTDLDPAEVSVELVRLCESGYLAGTVKALSHPGHHRGLPGARTPDGGGRADRRAMAVA
jgi:hypothetical protein